nr:FUSC family protein [Acidipropionibacterium timonense]
MTAPGPTTVAKPPAHPILANVLKFHPAPDTGRNALLTVIPIAVSLVVISLVLDPAHGMAGMMGAMGAMAGRTAPPRTRLKVLIGVGVALLASQAIGMSVASIPWLLPPVLAAWTLLVEFGWHGLQLGPPGPLNTLFAAAFGSYMATEGWSYGRLLPATALDFVVAAAASMALILLMPNRPARMAVDKAVRSVDGFVHHPDDTPAHEVARLRSRAHADVHNAWWVLNDGVPPEGRRAPSEAWTALRDRLLASHLELEEAMRLESFPSASVELPEQVEHTPLGRPSRSYLLRTAAERGSRPLMVAMRAATGVLFAATAMELLPFGRTYWAVLSVLIMLHMDQSRADMTIRAILRVLGTVVGLAAYLGIVAAHPTDWARVVIVIAAVWCMEALIPHQYGLSVIFITIFALTLTPVAAETQALLIARDRIEETVVGLLVGIGVIQVVGRRAPVLLVRSQYRRTLRSMMPVLRDLEAGTANSAEGMVHRNHLVHEIVRGSGVLSATRPDAPTALQRWSRVDRVVTETGYDLMACCWHSGDTPAPWARRIHSDIALLMASLPPISTMNLDADRVCRDVETIREQIVRSM